MKQELYAAVLLHKQIENDKIELFLPTRLLIGTMDENNQVFYDAISHRSFYNLDNYSDTENYYGFYHSVPLTKFFTEYSYKSLIQNLSDYLMEIKKKAYYYSLENGDVEDFLLKSMPIQEFMKKYQLKINYQYSAEKIDNVNFEELIKVNEELAKQVVSTSQEESVSLDIPPIDELYDQIKKNVLCQDNQIKKILTAIYKNLLFDESKLKSNIFIYGPSGVGKTAILNQISDNLKIPIVIEDATAYTIAGYVGKSCEDALKRLYYAANCDIDVAEHGILVFDEIDKKNSKGDSDCGVSSDGVLNSLLKIIEGGVFELELDKKSSETVEFDTSHLTVIVSGAFEKMLKRSNNNSTIGFNSVHINNESENSLNVVDKLVHYGMPKEFIGRFNTFVRLNSLGKDDLKQILVNSESSALKLYIANLAAMGIKLKFDNDLIERICDLAYSRNTGARALNNIVSELLDDIMFDVFCSDMQPREITVDSSALKEKKLIKTIVQENSL